MIEIKFWNYDIEGIANFGIYLLKNNYIYKLRKNGDFVIFSISCGINDRIEVIKSEDFVDNTDYCKFSLVIGEGKPLLFKAFALKIY